jgi:hypothetical protein
MSSHSVPPPLTDRQGLSDAEAYFRRQEFGQVMRLERAPLGGTVLVPPEVAIQAMLQMGEISLKGLPVAQMLAADLDGDGRQERWVRLRNLPQGGTPAYLAVQTPAGWRVGPMAGWESEPHVRHDGRGVLAGPRHHRLERARGDAPERGRRQGGPVAAALAGAGGAAVPDGVRSYGDPRAVGSVEELHDGHDPWRLSLRA